MRTAHRPTPKAWRTTPSRLSATAYSVYSQLPFISGGRPPISNDVTPVLCIGTQFWVGKIRWQVAGTQNKCDLTNFFSSVCPPPRYFISPRRWWNFAWFEASATEQMRTALFRVITQRVVAISWWEITTTRKKSPLRPRFQRQRCEIFSLWHKIVLVAKCKCFSYSVNSFLPPLQYTALLFQVLKCSSPGWIRGTFCSWERLLTTKEINQFSDPL